MSEFGPEKDQLDAWLTAFETVLGGAHAYRSSQLPDVLPDEYLEVRLTRRLSDSTRMSGGPRPWIGWRLLTRTVAVTSESAEVIRYRASLLSDTFLPGLECTALKFEGEDPIGLDDGRYSGLTQWTYCSKA